MQAVNRFIKFPAFNYGSRFSWSIFNYFITIFKGFVVRLRSTFSFSSLLKSRAWYFNYNTLFWITIDRYFNTCLRLLPFSKWKFRRLFSKKTFLLFRFAKWKMLCVIFIFKRFFFWNFRFFYAITDILCFSTFSIITWSWQFFINLRYLFRDGIFFGARFTVIFCIIISVVFKFIIQLFIFRSRPSDHSYKLIIVIILVYLCSRCSSSSVFVNKLYQRHQRIV